MVPPIYDAGALLCDIQSLVYLYVFISPQFDLITPVMPFLFQGPVLQVWYMKLENLKAKSLYAQTVKKVTADQLVAAPVILLTVMSAVSLLEGHSVDETKEKLKNYYCEVLLTNYKVSQFSDFLIVITDVSSIDCKLLRLEEYELSKSRKVYCHLDFHIFTYSFTNITIYAGQ